MELIIFEKYLCFQYNEYGMQSIMEDNKKTQEPTKNKKKPIISAIVATVLVLLGASYAWFRLVIQGTKKVTIAAGELSLQIFFKIVFLDAFVI